MRKIITIIITLISLSVYATTYYVAPDGDDSNPGTISEPWKTWGKAFNAKEVQPGDTVYFRGGVYFKNLAEGESSWYYPSRSENGSGYKISRSGVSGNSVHYFAYPLDFNEGNYPILDCRYADPDYRFNYGIRSGGVNYAHFKGLHVRNVLEYKYADNSDVTGVDVGGDSIIFENCKFYNISGCAFTIHGSAGTKSYIINCDAHNCCDSMDVDSPGNDGTGFRHEGAGTVYFKYCRAWLCGDQGFSNFVNVEQYATQYTEYEGCWSFSNGMMSGFGHGFKMGWITHTDGNLKRVYKNCIAAYNRMEGWKTNDYIKNSAVSAQLYNNTSYHNGYDPNWDYVWSGGATGFSINKTNDTQENELMRILKNNIAYNNQDGAVKLGLGASYTHEYNSWDIPQILTDADFISLDSTGISGLRQANGSLPDLKGFLKLSSTSKAIDVGVDVGLPYNGTAPDMGAYEYNPAEPPAPPDVATGAITKLTPYTAEVRISITSDGGGTILESGVCWSTSEDPTTSDSKTEEGEQSGTFTTIATGLLKGTTYYFRGYAINETATSYGENVEYTTQAAIPIFNDDNDKWIFFNGKPLF